MPARRAEHETIWPETRLGVSGQDDDFAGTPDLIIHYHASITQRIDVNRVDRGYATATAPTANPA